MTEWRLELIHVKSESFKIVKVIIDTIKNRFKIDILSASKFVMQTF